MVSIIKQFPFDFCEKCTKLSPHLNATAWFSGEDLVEHELFIGCDNAQICRELYENMEERRKQEHEDLQEGVSGIQPAEEDPGGPGGGGSQAEEAAGSARAEVPSS